jgi:hypothetical protein
MTTLLGPRTGFPLFIGKTAWQTGTILAGMREV